MAVRPHFSGDQTPPSKPTRQQVRTPSSSEDAVSRLAEDILAGSPSSFTSQSPESQFTTPTSTRKISYTPAAPARARNANLSTPQGTPISKAPPSLFEHPLERRETLTNDPFHLASSDILCREYDQGPNTHTIIKQFNPSGGCGSAALLMLCTDIAQTEREFQVRESFWNWYGGQLLTMAEEIKDSLNTHTNINKIGYVFTRLKLDNPDATPLETIKERLEETGLPVIASITHELIGGHWIIIDAITDEGVYFRDPYAGEAYCLDQKTMLDQFDDDGDMDLQYCLYLERDILWLKPQALTFQ